MHQQCRNNANIPGSLHLSQMTRLILGAPALGLTLLAEPRNCQPLFALLSPATCLVSTG